MTGIARLDREYECGTRSAYVRGCRCDACREANRAAARERVERVDAARADVAPSGPPLAGTMLRGGIECRIRRCPGANGAVCVRGGTWMRGATIVCTACVERAVVWNGLVPPDRARAHLRSLSESGVGYKAVSAACDVAPSTLCRIISKDATPIRARVERAILAVDAGAMADGALVDSAETNAKIATLRARGFTLRHLARLVGYSTTNTYCQLGRTARVTLATAAKIEKLFRRALSGELAPERAAIEAPAEHEMLQRCFAAGLTERWLSNAIGVSVHKAGTARMRVSTVAAIRDWLARTKEQLHEGLPEGWNLADASAVADAFSWGGGFSVGRSRATFTHKPKPAPKAPRPALTDDERRTIHREKQRARRERLGTEAVRAQNLKHQRARRARMAAQKVAA